MRLPLDDAELAAPGLDGLWLSPRRAAQPVWGEVAKELGVELHTDVYVPDKTGLLFKDGQIIAFIDFTGEGNGHSIIKTGWLRRLRELVWGPADA